MKILTLLLVLAFMSVGGCGGLSDNEEKPINNPVLKAHGFYIVAIGIDEHIP